MDTIKYLLKFLFRFAVVMFFVAIVWWGVVAFNPGFSLQTILYVLTSPNATSSMQSGWLPAPGSFKGLLANIHGQPSVGYGSVFNGFDNGSGDSQYRYVDYQEESQATVNAYVQSSVSGNSGQNTEIGSQKQNTNINIGNTFAQKSMYLRSLSLYEGGHIYTGLSFTGEARNLMFVNGKFPIIIAEQSTGRVLAVATAEATSNWATPGWVRFQTKVSSLNSSTARSCLMIFEQARSQGSQIQPVRVAIPIQCN